MGVIAFPNLSPQGPNPTFSWELRSISARHKSPLNGVATTLERPGSEWAVRMPYANLATSRRARLQTFAAAARGHAQRFYVPYYGWTRRGSFPATELFSNTSFGSTTGWTVGAEYSLSASDSILRSTRTGMSLAQAAPTQSITLTAYTPYVCRAITHGGRGSFASVGPYFSGVTSSVGTPSYRTIAIVATATGAQIAGVLDNATSGLVAGDYFEISFLSLSQCALVDNGVNSLLQSDTFQTTWTTTNVSISANAGVAPDGTATADALVENAANGEHSVEQAYTVSSAAQDIEFTCSVLAGLRGFVALEIAVTGGTAAVYVNLTTGAISTAAAATGNVTNARAFVTNQGGGWRRISLVARKTGSETSVNCTVYSANVTGSVSYAGSDTSTAVYVWRAYSNPNGVPSRGRQTTTTASTGTAQTGSGLHLKGLPVSTSGLLLPGDPVEVVTNTSTQLVRTAKPLNSDAAGLGYFEFEAPIRVSPLENAAVIIQSPLCRMMMDSNVAGWSERAAGFSDLEFTAVEDTYP